MIHKLCMKCTKENIRRSLEEDTVGRKSLVYRFVSLLENLKENTVIAVDGGWGSGKTFFVMQADLVLTEPDPNRQVSHLTVYYDAWKHDADGDPLLSLIYDIYTHVHSDYSFDEIKGVEDISKEAENLPLPKFASSALKIWNFCSGLSVKDKPFARLKQERELQDHIHAFLKSVLPEKADRLVIFVDELDRCSPDFAVKLLERIKHYFDSDDITFVLSVDAAQLQATIKHHYGQDFRAGAYLDRFFDLRFSLPPVDAKLYLACLGLSTEGYSHIVELIRHFSFEMREITRYIRLLQIAQPFSDYQLSRQDRAMFTTLAFLKQLIVPLMIALHVHDAEEYRAFISGENPDPLLTSYDPSLAGEYYDFYLFKENEPTGITTARLTLVYEALFGQTKMHVDNRIGRLYIDESAKNALLQTVSLLSSNSTFGTNAR